MLLLQSRLVVWVNCRPKCRPKFALAFCYFDDYLSQVDQDTLHKLIIAANYLEIPRLFTAACEKVQRLSEIAANNDMMMYRFGLYQSGKCCELPMSPDDAPRPSVIIDDTPEIDIDSI